MVWNPFFCSQKKKKKAANSDFELHFIQPFLVKGI